MQGLCYFIAFGTVLLIMFVVGVICDIPKHLPKRNRFLTCAHYYIYKAFMDMVKERNLRPYTLVMSYEQIISMLNVPELNLQDAIIDPSTCYIMDDKAFLSIYTYKHYKEGGLTRSIFYDSLREKNGLILFIPKNYRDYRRLCRYFANIDTSQMDDDTTAKQMDSLKYLTDLIHQAQDRHRETLQNCQAEMDKEIRKCKAQNPYFRNRSNSANEK